MNALPIDFAIWFLVVDYVIGGLWCSTQEVMLLHANGSANDIDNKVFPANCYSSWNHLSLATCPLCLFFMFFPACVRKSLGASCSSAF